MEAAQTSALALYVGLNLLLTFLLALNVVRHRFKGDSVDQVKLEKAVRAHGNNTEYVPIILIGLGVIALMGACLLYTSPSPRDSLSSRMPSSA